MSVAEAIQLVFTAIGLSVVFLFAFIGIGKTLDEIMDRKEESSKSEIDKQFESIIRD